MNEYQQWTIYLNQWAEYLWTMAMDRYVKIQQAEQQSKQYFDFYQRWTQFHEKIEHYQQMVQKKGLIPPYYKKQLRTELQSFQFQMDRKEIHSETAIDPTWLLDSQASLDPWTLYIFWYWIYDLFRWNESMQNYSHSLEKQNQHYEIMIYTRFPQWYEETMKRI